MTQPNNHKVMLNEFEAALQQVRSGPLAYQQLQQPYIPSQAPRQEQPVPPPYDYDNPNGILDDDNFGRKPEKHDGGRGTAIKWLCGVITCAGIIGFVGYEVLHPSPKGHETAAVTELSTAPHTSLDPTLTSPPTDLPSTEPSVSPSETSLPTDSSTTSTTPSSSPSPTSIPKFTLAGSKLDCTSAATISVSESIPVAISRKFDGTFLAADGKSTVADPNTYTFQAGSGADINVALSGTASLKVCVPDASKLFIADSSAAAGTNAYTVDLSKVATQLDPSKVEPTLGYATNGQGVPKVLIDLCAEGADAEKAKKTPTPVETAACADTKKDWSDQAHPPVSNIFNQIKNQVSGGTNDIVTAATAILYGQLDKEQMQNMEAPVKTFLSAGLQSLAKEQGVSAQNVLIDQFTGDLASQQAAYLAKYPNAKNEIASILKTYILGIKNVKTYLAKYPSTSTDLLNLLAVYQKQDPTAKSFPFYADDSPNPSASITVTAVEQKQD